MRKDEYEKRWRHEREPSLKHNVRSNVKHPTKEYAPGQTAAQEKISRAASWKAESIFKKLKKLTYLLT